MPLWTTYLSNWCNHKEEILKMIGAVTPRTCAIAKFVMMNRGNNEVAPTKEMLEAWKDAETKFKNGKIAQGELEYVWTHYEEQYKQRLAEDLADEWVFELIHGDLADDINVILICFEKDSTHCHRRLLAEWITNYYPDTVDYRGEIILGE